jgi:hypothetical protein
MTNEFRPTAFNNAIIIYFFTKQATLMRRSTVRRFPLQLVFPALTISPPTCELQDAISFLFTKELTALSLPKSALLTIFALPPSLSLSLSLSKICFLPYLCSLSHSLSSLSLLFLCLSLSHHSFAIYPKFFFSLSLSLLSLS